VPIHQQIWLAAEHWFGNWPNDLLNLVWDFEHLTKFNRRLCACLQHTTEEEVVRQDFLLLFIDGYVIFLLLWIWLFHILKNFQNAGASLPCQLWNDSYFDFSELIIQFRWHIMVQLQKDVENSPQIKRWLVYELHEIVDLHVFYVSYEEFNFTGANNDRLEEHWAVDKLLHFIDSLLFCVTDKHSFQNLRCHPSDILRMYFLQLLHSIFDSAVIVKLWAWLDILFGKAHYNAIDKFGRILSNLLHKLELFWFVLNVQYAK